VVERRQEEINQMQDRIYKKFQTEVKRFLVAAEKQAADRHAALWGARLTGVKNIRSDIYVKV
jgi:hypothetical protein